MAASRHRKNHSPRIVIDLTEYPDVFAAINEAAGQMDWSPSTLLRRNLIAAFNAGVDFKNALANLGTALKRPWMSENQ